jgi:hypothetical protein
MSPREYCEVLLNLYIEASKYPIVKLTKVDDDHYSLSFRRVMSHHQYNLGFRLKRCSWLWANHVNKNRKLLEVLIQPENDNLLFTVVIKKSYCIFYLYDRYGVRRNKTKIKYLSISI